MEYTYLLIDGSLYINLESNMLNLMYFLLFKAEPLTFFEKKTNSKVLNYFKPLVRLKRVLEFIYLFYRRKQIYSKSKDSFPAITTTFDGHCLMILRLGEYKIINFRKKNITTVFPNNFSIAEIRKNIQKLVDAQKCSLAPRVINWDINMRNITENYVNLKTSKFDYVNNRNFYLEVFPILLKIMESTNPQRTLSKQYIEKIIYRIEILMGIYLNQDSSSDIPIIEFFSYIKKELTFHTEKELLLVLSHGDFWGGNILKNKTKYRVIDWNTIDMRSFYFDFYFIMFDKAFKKNKVTWINFAQEIDTDFKHFELYL
ncbi:hypothetical protein V7147_22425, partial [Bacillus sp. JJ1521]|uniref:hypothetical protein n=1 Tax=Bacillus sp. JJ1521 TaxID=3122957 RepID=UPI003000144E